MKGKRGMKPMHKMTGGKMMPGMKHGAKAKKKSRKKKRKSY